MRGLIEGLANPHPLAMELPSPYQGESFTERFLSVFDDAMAPVLSTLDNVDSYLAPALTPPDFLPWLAGWVGVELDENWSEAQQRRLVAEAVRLMSWRGTQRGMVDLVCNYLDLDPADIEVTDSGGVAWSATPNGEPSGSSPARLQVTVRAPVPEDIDVARLRRLVASAIPAHVAHQVDVQGAP